MKGGADHSHIAHSTEAIELLKIRLVKTETSKMNTTVQSPATADNDQAVRILTAPNSYSH